MCIVFVWTENWRDQRLGEMGSVALIIGLAI